MTKEERAQEIKDWARFKRRVENSDEMGLTLREYDDMVNAFAAASTTMAARTAGNSLDSGNPADLPTNPGQ